ncbi:hypothetical protein M426DRAFT_316534 [Hypoxylon sp. CI-4A]|nr:hypothetical protein M426DRAFT_316534 [Hypoxylon sp. CI-4A]
MDPLSIIASILGISQAGVSVTRALLDTISAYRDAPKEILDISSRISDLSTILSELRRILKNGGKDFCSRKLLRGIDSAIMRISRIHNEIKKRLRFGGSINQLKWAFRRAKCIELLYQIESHKNGINTILHTINLALQLELLSEIRVTTQPAGQAMNDTQEEASLARQQAENSIDMSYHSIRDFVTQRDQHIEPSIEHNDRERVVVQEGGSSTRVQASDVGSGDTAMWLYDLVFSSATESHHMTENSSGATQLDESEERAGREARQGDTPGQLVLLQGDQTQSLSSLIQRPVSSATVADGLLSEWITPAQDQSESTVRSQEEGIQGVRETDQIIRFTDAVGRKFNFPWRLAQSWLGMERLIKDAFHNVPIVGPHVMKGYYDLFRPGEYIILPSVWDSIVEPGWTIGMQMWPTLPILPHDNKKTRPVDPIANRRKQKSKREPNPNPFGI